LFSKQESKGLDDLMPNMWIQVFTALYGTFALCEAGIDQILVNPPVYAKLKSSLYVEM